MHLERLLSSAEMARIEVKFSHAQLRDILLETMAAAGRPGWATCTLMLILRVRERRLSDISEGMSRGELVLHGNFRLPLRLLDI
eukprot:1354303-Amorphochlora_amoeboformis.AAC.1